MRQMKVRLFKALGVFMASMVLSVCFVGASMAASVARSTDSTGAPPALQEWADWAGYQQEFRQCPMLSGTVGSNKEDFLCVWPGVLTLEVDNKGARFKQYWQVAVASWVLLPGDSRHWPLEVSVNDLPHPVLFQGGMPSLWLEAGEYDVQGRILWAERPQALSVPAQTALIALNVDGKSVQPLQREGSQLTLGRSTTTVPEAADSVELQVYRRLTDSIPALLTTMIQLQVSGKAREIQVTPVLPEGFVATALETPWPTRLDAEGNLHIQVQPGRATLTLVARATTPLTQLKARLPETLSQEVWSYAAVPSLRTTTVTADGDAMSVDPRQAGVPAAWQSLPAFAVGAASKLNIEERSRGLAADETNRLTLKREMWLDFSGEGYFAKDVVSGRMQQGWRFDVAPPYQLQRASTRGDALLVTKGASKADGEGTTWTGVEWRNPHVALDASVRIATEASSLPVTGWQQTFDQVDTVLHLPYGHKLLAAPGADASNDSWVAQWRILDIFFAAFISLLAWRLLGLGGGMVTAAYLLLALQEFGSPLWALAIALVLGLLYRALPNGRLGKALSVTYAMALAVLFLVAIVFVPDQLRSALYPQLEGPDNVYHAAKRETAYDSSQFGTLRMGGGRFDGSEDEDMRASPSVIAAEPPPPPLAEVAPPPSPSIPPPSLSLNSAIGRSVGAPAIGKRYTQALNAVQTGAGEPDWKIGQHYSLRWTGPVTADQTVTFIVSPAWLTRLLRVVMVVLLGLILWRMARTYFSLRSKSTPSSPLSSEKTGTAVTAMLATTVLAGALCMHPSTAWANDSTVFPSEYLLRTLQQRIQTPPRCAPDCATIAKADIHALDSKMFSSIQPDLRVILEAHAGDHVALPLPMVEDNAVLLSVRVGGKKVGAVRSCQEKEFVALPRGVHFVELEYAVSGDTTSLHFSLRPHRVVFNGVGWRADGMDEDRLISETVHLSRVDDEAQKTAGAATKERANEAQQFPPYVQVTRTLRFDLDWTVDTLVARISPRTGGVALTVPLLANEHVTTPGIKVQDERATVSLGHTESQTQWHSRLDKSETLTLTAPALSERAEIWRVEVSPLWRIRWDGVPVTLHNESGEAVFEFHPLPGETLSLTLDSPSAVEGRLRAIDRASVNHEIGDRASQHTLSFTLRASQGGEHVITLPPSEMEVLNVMRDQQRLNLRPVDGTLTLPVLPGAQTFSITLREAREANTLMRMPVFDLGLPAANIDIGARLPKKRWLLASFGPSVGPAVLYWGELVVALVLAFLLAFLLARRGWTTLRFHHWFLLVLGFSTFSWVALALIIFWLIVLDWRKRAGELPDWKAWRFNCLQLGLALLSMMALYCLFRVIPDGLLGKPDMGVTGHGSDGNHLLWFADQSEDSLPSVMLVSLPLWVYHVAMLIWALWLANAVIGWLRRGLAGWMQGGYWRKGESALRWTWWEGLTRKKTSES